MTITMEDFKKVDLRVAEIVEAEKVEGADRLLKLTLEVGGVRRTAVAALAPFYQPEELVGTVIWLFSDASSFVTGTLIPIDWGYSSYTI